MGIDKKEKDYLYEVGTCERTGIKLVYRETDENMKNHPKYKFSQEIGKEIDHGNSPTSPTT